jgi:hypothetical protein
MYCIYYNHPQAGRVVKSIIKGKSEALKRLNELNKLEDEVYYMKEWNM